MPQPSLLLVHGALTGAWVWDEWRKSLGALGWQVNVIDLRGHGRSLPTDLAAVTMEDYVADLASVTVQIERSQGVHPVIGGWNMGGMVAMMYAAQHPETPAMLLFDSIMPAEISKADIDTVRKFAGNLLTPAVFGIDPHNRDSSRSVLFDLTDEELEGFLSRSDGAGESGVALRQALRGISVPAEQVACPALVLAPEGNNEGAGHNARLAEYLRGDLLSVPEVGHWGIVCHARAVDAVAPEVDRWLRRSVGSRPEEVTGNGA